MASNLSELVESDADGSIGDSPEVEELKVHCPLGCGYEGRRESVEAHISSKTDDLHRGEVGHLHREELEEQGSGVHRSPPTETPSEDGDDTDSTDPDGENVETDLGEEEGKPEIEDDEFAELPADAEASSEDVDGDDQEDVDDVAEAAVTATGAAGAGLAADALDRGISTWHVVGLIVVVGVGWYLLASSDSSSDAGTDDDVDGDEGTDDEQAAGWEVWE